MNAGSTEARAAALLAVSLMVLACERLAQDPPPPPSRHEVPGAPPAAIGAHVASRPAEPLPVERTVPGQEGSDSESEGDVVPGPDGGSDSGGHAPEPEGVAL